MTEWAAKRFWQQAEVSTADGAYWVTLDGKPIRTPAKAPLALPTRSLADAIAAEWAAQGEKIAPLTMPCTRSANAAIDKVLPQQDEVVEMLADYGDSDLICYRADSPDRLVARQAAAWDPLIAFAAETYGAVLEPRTGVMPVAQDPRSLSRLRDEVARLDAFQLAAFHDLVSLSGSLVIGLAVTRGFGAPQDLWAVSRIDELWQIEQWGEDDEATAYAAQRAEAFFHAARFYELVTH